VCNTLQQTARNPFSRVRGISVSCCTLGLVLHTRSIYVCNKLQHKCITLQGIPFHECVIKVCRVAHWDSWCAHFRHMCVCESAHTATHCNTLNTLQHTATHCNTLQHTATHWTYLCVRISIRSDICDKGTKLTHIVPVTYVNQLGYMTHLYTLLTCIHNLTHLHDIAYMHIRDTWLTHMHDSLILVMSYMWRGHVDDSLIHMTPSNTYA